MPQLFASGCCSDAAPSRRGSGRVLGRSCEHFWLLHAASELSKRRGRARTDRYHLMRKIDRLEEELGFKLFLRDQIGLSLSDEGTALTVRRGTDGTLSFNIFRRASLSPNTSGHGARRRDRRTRQFLDASEADRFPEDLPQDHGRPALRDGTSRRRRAWKRISRSSSSGRPIPISSSPSSAGFTSITFVSEGYRDSSTEFLHPCRSQESPHRQAAWRPQVDDTAYARILGLDLAGRHCRHKDKLQRCVLYAVERGAGVGFLPTSAIALGAPLVAIDLGINHHCRSLAHLSQGVSQFRSPQDRHRLA